MPKENYTHIKELLPAIRAMVAEGMSQREIAEYVSFKDKFAAKEALKRAGRRAITTPISEAASLLRHCKTSMRRSG